MKKLLTIVAFLAGPIFYFSCQKEVQIEDPGEELSTASISSAAQPPFNMQVILRGEGKRFGHIKFRQDVDPSKIIVLETWIRDLSPNTTYILQRAVDPINVVDGNCTSSNWLTLGKGLTPQSILTDAKGTGKEELWRDISGIPSGSKFDIHFRVLNATTMEEVLSSDCYLYVVR